MSIESCVFLVVSTDWHGCFVEEICEASITVVFWLKRHRAALNRLILQDPLQPLQELLDKDKPNMYNTRHLQHGKRHHRKHASLTMHIPTV